MGLYNTFFHREKALGLQGIYINFDMNIFCGISNPLNANETTIMTKLSAYFLTLIKIE